MLPDPTSPVPQDGTLKPFINTHLPPQHITVLGAGAFGYAIAVMLARNRHHVTLVDVVEQRINHIQEKRYNPDFLTEFEYPASGRAVFNPADAFTKDTKYVFFAIPIQFSADYLKKIQPFILREHLVAQDPTYQPQPIIFVNLAKGIHGQRLQLIYKIFDEVFDVDHEAIAEADRTYQLALKNAQAQQLAVPDAPAYKGQIHFCYMAGPSFADEICKGEITGFVAASPEAAIGKDVATLLSMDEKVMCQYSTDYIGVQASGALKNCMAIWCGMLSGSGYKNNTLCLAIALCSMEIRRITHYIFNPKGTLADETAGVGLSGFGDLVLTCTGQSRNKALGEKMSQGLTLDQALKSSAGVVEGVPTVKAIYELLEKADFVKHAPIIRALYAVMFQNQTVESAVEYIASMPPQNEYI